MKTLASLLCLFCCHAIVAQASIESFAEEVHSSVENLTECMEHSGATIDELKLQKQRSVNDETIEPEAMRKTTCFWACLMQQQGVMTGSTINSDLMAKYIRSFGEKHGAMEMNSDLDKAVEDCVNSVKDIDDECDALLAFNECTFKNWKP